MIPRGMFCAHLLSLADAAYELLRHEDTPNAVRQQLRKFVRKLRRDLPREAQREIEAAEAKATIRAADYFRLRDSDSPVGQGERS